MRLLLVEDDPMIGDSVHRGLKREGFAVDWVAEAESAEPALRSGNYDLLLLDLGLPRKSGLVLLKELRAHGSGIPVLVLTARDAVADRVLGLDTGADDYLVKPFDLDELGARVRALLRRQAGRTQPEISYGDLRLNPATHEAVFRGTDLTLSAREFTLLVALLEKPGAVLSRGRLEERLYGWGEEVESNAIEVHVHNLRKKLGTAFIRTVRGVGYMVPRRP